MNSTPGEQPLRPPLSADVAARVARAERRRGRVVKSLLLLGSLTFGAGLIPSTLAARAGQHLPSALGLVLLLVGLLIMFPVAALAALLVGPTWRQRQDHWRLLHWEARQARWLAARGSRRDAASLPSGGQERFGETLPPTEIPWRQRDQAGHAAAPGALRQQYGLVRRRRGSEWHFRC